MPGPAVTISDRGFPVRPVDDGAPGVTLADGGAPIVISDYGAPFVVDGYDPFPASLEPVLWIEAARGGLFQSNAGSLPAEENGNFVGYVPDMSGNGNHYTSVADDNTRPTLQNIGSAPCLRFDGSNDVLRRTASLGILETGYTLAIAIKGNSPAADSRLFAEGNSASNNTLFISVQASSTTPTSSSAMYRNDGGIQLVNPATTENAGVFDGDPKVLIVTDDRLFVRTYVNGVAGASTGWTPSGSFTLNRSAIGALMRATVSNHWAGDVYGIIAIDRVITNDERSELTTYMGNIAGLSL